MGEGEVGIALREEDLGDYLRGHGLLPNGEVDVAPAGDGNINWVRRVRHRASGKSWIVKQARPALERFPQYRASTERIVFENRFYELVRSLDRDRICPEVACFDGERKVLVLEDLGDPDRLDRALLAGREVGAALEALAAFLGRVHASTASQPDLAERFQNDDMRRLHGEHIFRLPFEPNDFPLDERVRARARRVQQDPRLVQIAATAYERYREPHGALVHADPQAGNVLLPDSQPKLLDPEIAHVGDPAFDMGTLLAHLWMPALRRGAGAAAREVTERAWRAYATAHAERELPHFGDVARYAGIEIMRRTIGAARVTAVEPVEVALRAIDLAERLMRDPPDRPEQVDIS